MRQKTIFWLLDTSKECAEKGMEIVKQNFMMITMKTTTIAQKMCKKHATCKLGIGRRKVSKNDDNNDDNNNDDGVSFNNASGNDDNDSNNEHMNI